MLAVMEKVARCVVAVPPLLWSGENEVDQVENDRLVKHIEAGGVRVLMYGGNANWYHLGGREFPQVLSLLSRLGGEETIVIPSAGPVYGDLDRSADMFREYDFPTVMMLPTEVSTSSGVLRGARRFASRLDKPIVLYVRHINYVDPAEVARHIADGVIGLVKYGHVAADPKNDNYLAKLVDAVGADRILSGSGEVVAYEHFKRFDLLGYTTGSGCIAPFLSTCLRAALAEGDVLSAEALVSEFRDFEAQRDQSNPILALHEGVALAGLVPAGPPLPMLHELSPERRATVGAAARALLSSEQRRRRASFTETPG